MSLADSAILRDVSVSFTVHAVFYDCSHSRAKCSSPQPIYFMQMLPQSNRGNSIRTPPLNEGTFRDLRQCNNDPSPGNRSVSLRCNADETQSIVCTGLFDRRGFSRNTNDSRKLQGKAKQEGPRLSLSIHIQVLYI